MLLFVAGKNTGRGLDQGHITKIGKITQMTQMKSLRFKIDHKMSNIMANLKEIPRVITKLTTRS